MKQWKCTVCGYIHTGDEPPEFCPVCGAAAENFELVVEAKPVQVEKKKTPRWRCKVCGYIHEGYEPPDNCPVCGAPRTSLRRSKPKRQKDISSSVHMGPTGKSSGSVLSACIFMKAMSLLYFARDVGRRRNSLSI